MKARRVGVRVQKESGGWVVYRIDSHAFPKRVLIAAFRSKDKAALFAKKERSEDKSDRISSRGDTGDVPELVATKRCSGFVFLNTISPSRK